MSTSDQCRAMVGTQPTHPTKTQGVSPLLSAGHRTRTGREGPALLERSFYSGRVAMNKSTPEKNEAGWSTALQGESGESPRPRTETCGQRSEEVRGGMGRHLGRSIAAGTQPVQSP